MKNLFTLSFIICSIFCISACGGGDDGPTDPPVTDGDISGGVNLYDDKNIPLPNDGMTVTIVGRSESAVTDAEGRFRLEGVPFGSYQLRYEKNGFGTFIGPEFEHEANDNGITFITDSPSLGQISTTIITNGSAALDGNDFLLTVESEPGGNNQDPVYVSIFLRGSDDVSNENNSAVIGPLQIAINPFNIRITQQQLLEFGFSADETVYIKVYGDSFFANNYERLGSTIHPNANQNASPTMNLVVQ